MSTTVERAESRRDPLERKENLQLTTATQRKNRFSLGPSPQLIDQLLLNCRFDPTAGLIADLVRKGLRLLVIDGETKAGRKVHRQGRDDYKPVFAADVLRDRDPQNGRRLTLLERRDILRNFTEPAVTLNPNAAVKPIAISLRHHARLIRRPYGGSWQDGRNGKNEDEKGDIVFHVQEPALDRLRGSGWRSLRSTLYRSRDTLFQRHQTRSAQL
nr:hypothetical protein [Algihabitans albus]